MLQILVVDDDKNTRRYLTAVLSDAGYSVSCAECAQTALNIMENTKIDLIVLDIMMPGMDGYAFAELLRDCNNDIPILMLSARQLPEDVKKGFLSGTDDYMTKPVDESRYASSNQGPAQKGKDHFRPQAYDWFNHSGLRYNDRKKQRNHPASSPEGVPAFVQTSILSKQNFYANSAYGGYLGTRLRFHGRNGQRPH